MMGKIRHQTDFFWDRAAATPGNERQHASNNLARTVEFVFDRVIPRVFRLNRGPGLMRKPGKTR